MSPERFAAAQSRAAVALLDELAALRERVRLAEVERDEARKMLEDLTDLNRRNCAESDRIRTASESLVNNLYAFLRREQSNIAARSASSTPSEGRNE